MRSEREEEMRETVRKREGGPGEREEGERERERGEGETALTFLIAS